ncbi:MAG: hypothetical protein GY705_29670, partial [Bacteroidetes bacterium]|nr:hypothetical protein [Bacteroidota bacterium]
MLDLTIEDPEKHGIGEKDLEHYLERSQKQGIFPRKFPTIHPVKNEDKGISEMLSTLGDQLMIKLIPVMMAVGEKDKNELIKKNQEMKDDIVAAINNCYAAVTKDIVTLNERLDHEFENLKTKTTEEETSEEDQHSIKVILKYIKEKIEGLKSDFNSSEMTKIIGMLNSPKFSKTKIVKGSDDDQVDTILPTSCKVIKDYVANNTKDNQKHELSLITGETILIIDDSNEKSWLGENQHQNTGYFPSDHVEKITESEESKNERMKSEKARTLIYQEDDLNAKRPVINNISPFHPIFVKNEEFYRSEQCRYLKDIQNPPKNFNTSSQISNPITMSKRQKRRLARREKIIQPSGLSSPANPGKTRPLSNKNKARNTIPGSQEVIASLVITNSNTHENKKPLAQQNPKPVDLGTGSNRGGDLDWEENVSKKSRNQINQERKMQEGKDKKARKSLLLFGIKPSIDGMNENQYHTERALEVFDEISEKYLEKRGVKVVKADIQYVRRVIQWKGKEDPKPLLITFYSEDKCNEIRKAIKHAGFHSRRKKIRFGKYKNASEEVFKIIKNIFIWNSYTKQERDHYQQEKEKRKTEEWKRKNELHEKIKSSHTHVRSQVLDTNENSDPNVGTGNEEKIDQVGAESPTIPGSNENKNSGPPGAEEGSGLGVTTTPSHNNKFNRLKDDLHELYKIEDLEQRSKNGTTP